MKIDIATPAESTVGAAITVFGLSVDGLSPRSHQRGQLAFDERAEKDKVVPHKAELKILSEIRSRRKEGASFGQIANWLNSEGVPTKNRVKTWDRPTVYKMLKREREKVM